MTTTLQQEQATRASRRVRERTHPVRASALALLLTLWCLVVHGYHPYGEDGGVYLAGIKWLLNPHLYPHWTGFVTAHLRLTLFPLLIATTVRVTHSPLMVVMLLFYLAGIWLTMIASWQLAARCFPSKRERHASVLLLAAWLTLPIAGTSLMLTDPYLTARSLSTPLSIFALVKLLDFLHARQPGAPTAWRPLIACGATIAVSAAMHPLMSLYAGFFLTLMMALSARPRRRAVMVGSVVLAAIAIACLLYYTTPASEPAYMQVAHTRTYWFLDEWRWFEWCGLLAPIAIAGAVCFAARQDHRSPVILLARASVLAASTCAVIALAFAHPSSRTMLIASLQPLRQFHLVYILMILGLGAAFERHIARGRKLPWVATMLVFGAVMFFVQAKTFPHSAHMELPGLKPANEWDQAFFWVRGNLPIDAAVAIDSNYTTADGEDTQNFRAIAERSSIPDYSKDGGVASITPSLAHEWLQAQTVGTGFNDLTDAERKAKLHTIGAQWIVLPASAQTAFLCPYVNPSAKICRLN